MAMSPYEVALLEERRQAVGVAEISTESRSLGSGWLCFGGEGSWQNQAVGLGLEGPVGDDELDQLVGFYRELRVEPVIIVCPFADPSLYRGLAQRGFGVCGFENVLFRELDDEVDALAPVKGWPEGLDVRPLNLDDASEVDKFVEVSNSGFYPEDECVPPPLAEGTRRMLAHPGCNGFVAELGHTMVGGSALEVAGNVAALMAASVVRSARRLGIQQAMMVARMQRARASGAAVGTIQSKPGIPTERNARRLGFQVAYTRVELARDGVLPPAAEDALP